MALFQQQGSSHHTAIVSDTAIGAQVKISGTLHSESDVQFDGVLENGEVNIKGKLTVGESASMTAQVNADQLVVHGTIEGNITTAGDVEIGPTGKVEGDVNAGGNLVIHPGGIFIGKSMMQDKRTSAPASSRDSAQDTEEGTEE